MDESWVFFPVFSETEAGPVDFLHQVGEWIIDPDQSYEISKSVAMLGLCKSVFKTWAPKVQVLFFT